MCNRYGNSGYGMRREDEEKQFDRKGIFRVPVNITQNEVGYELLVFAPDREKEDFKINIKENELTISYELKNKESESKNWIRHEFRKTSFERTFIIDEAINSENVKTEYINGILHLVLPIIPDSKKPI